MGECVTVRRANPYDAAMTENDPQALRHALADLAAECHRLALLHGHAVEVADAERALADELADVLAAFVMLFDVSGGSLTAAAESVLDEHRKRRDRG